MQAMLSQLRVQFEQEPERLQHAPLSTAAASAGFADLEWEVVGPLSSAGSTHQRSRVGNQPIYDTWVDSLAAADAAAASQDWCFVDALGVHAVAAKGKDAGDFPRHEEPQQQEQWEEPQEQLQQEACVELKPQEQQEESGLDTAFADASSASASEEEEESAPVAESESDSTLTIESAISADDELEVKEDSAVAVASIPPAHSSLPVARPLHCHTSLPSLHASLHAAGQSIVATGDMEQIANQVSKSLSGSAVVGSGPSTAQKAKMLSLGNFLGQDIPSNPWSRGHA